MNLSTALKDLSLVCYDYYKNNIVQFNKPKQEFSDQIHDLIDEYHERFAAIIVPAPIINSPFKDKIVHDVLEQFETIRLLEARITDEFKTKIMEILELSDHHKSGVIWQLSWEQGGPNDLDAVVRTLIEYRDDLSL